MSGEHPGYYGVNPRSARRIYRVTVLRTMRNQAQRRGVDTSASGALRRKGDEWRGPFATESTERIIMIGIAIIGMTTAASQMLDAAKLMRTDESAGLERLADAIACAQEAYRAGSGNPAESIPDTTPRVIEVFRSNNSDETNAVSAECRARGERVIQFWETGAIVVRRFEHMSEGAIRAWIDAR